MAHYFLKVHPLVSEMQSSARKCRLIPAKAADYPIYIVFLLFSLPIGLGSVMTEWELFRMGLPLSFLSNLGSISGQKSMLFLFEIYILALAMVLVPRFLFAEPKRHLFSVQVWPRYLQMLFFLLLFLLGFWVLSFLFSVKENKLLWLRNSAFLWYLGLPLLLWLGRVPFSAVKALVFIVSLAVFYPLARSILFEDIIQFTPYVGMYPMLFFALIHKEKKLWIPSFVLISLAMVLSLKSGVQRTTLLGVLPVLGFAFWYGKSRKNFLLRTAGLLALILMAPMVFGGVIYQFLPMKKTQIGSTSPVVEKPVVRGELDASGKEIFRWTLWTDALSLFQENPWLGIGFEKPVVFRVYQWSGQFVPNDDQWTKALEYKGRPEQPAIAGPHNSYLNALARMGFLGILLLVLHLGCLFFFLLNRELLCASVLYAHMVYAFFNVGLEGPIRSAILLILLSGPFLYSSQAIEE